MFAKKPPDQEPQDQPISQDDHQQWRQAAGPEQPERGESPGIQAMNRWFPSSQPLTRERPPTSRIKITREQARQVRGLSLWRTPEQKREFNELYEVIDATPTPTPPKPQPQPNRFIAAAKVLLGIAEPAAEPTPTPAQGKPSTFFSR